LCLAFLHCTLAAVCLKKTIFRLAGFSFRQLPEAYQALCAWIAAQGKEGNGAPWESYITDPGELPDPKDWRTEVYWPLR
jgi:effector-binding domain-containing protein